MSYTVYQWFLILGLPYCSGLATAALIEHFQERK